MNPRFPGHSFAPFHSTVAKTRTSLLECSTIDTSPSSPTSKALEPTNGLAFLLVDVTLATRPLAGFLAISKLTDSGNRRDGHGFGWCFNSQWRGLIHIEGEENSVCELLHRVINTSERFWVRVRSIMLVGWLLLSCIILNLSVLGFY